MLQWLPPGQGWHLTHLLWTSPWKVFWNICCLEMQWGDGRHRDLLWACIWCVTDNSEPQIWVTMGMMELGTENGDLGEAWVWEESWGKDVKVGFRQVQWRNGVI
jgi:hypothetical protein